MKKRKISNSLKEVDEHRKVDCIHYTECTDRASEADLWNFTCSECSHYNCDYSYYDRDIRQKDQVLHEPWISVMDLEEVV